jgi:hypothetical protein
MKDNDFERQTRQLLQAGVEQLPARLRSRLTRARHAALAAARRPERRPWRVWAPAGGLAAAAVLALGLLQPHLRSVTAVNLDNGALEDIELLTDGDALDLAQEQEGGYDFYEWAAAEADGGSAAVGS